MFAALSGFPSPLIARKRLDNMDSPIIFNLSALALASIDDSSRTSLHAVAPLARNVRGAIADPPVLNAES